jgi:hypothetical protein
MVTTKHLVQTVVVYVQSCTKYVQCTYAIPFILSQISPLSVGMTSFNIVIISSFIQSSYLRTIRLLRC